MIVICEVGFWLVLAAGLAARYLLRWRRIGAVLLIGVPIVDATLFVATVLDLRHGGTASWTHGLAAVYLGYSVAFGHTTIRWADRHVAYRVAGGPRPARPPRHGPERVRYEWREFGKGMLGWAVCCALLLAGVAWVGDATRTAALTSWLWKVTLAMVIWLVCWPVWETVTAARHTRER